jgi:tetratricopeptide (TPR) repeat protein
VSGAPEELLRHFRSAFAADPAEAYREWFRAQEELRDAEGEREAGIARALADDLWEQLEELSFPAAEVRARFLHNLGVFLGSPGPASDIERSRRMFLESIELFEAGRDEAWLARAHHNFATSLSNLGTTAPDLEESLRLFDRALAWRTSEREIARGVTLHNRGLALRRLAELDPARAPEHLAESAGVFDEAAKIRERHGLADGRARSLFHRGVTLLRLAGGEDPASPARLEAARCLEQAARIFDALGKTDSSAAARELAGAV